MSLTAAGLNSEIVAEKEKKKEEDGEKKAKATHAGWNNNHVEMKTTLSAVCHLLTEVTKRHFLTCSVPAVYGIVHKLCLQNFIIFDHLKVCSLVLESLQFVKIFDHPPT